MPEVKMLTQGREDMESCTYDTCGEKILSKDYTLTLNDEEVDQLFDIIEKGFESFAWDSVIATGSERARESTT